MARVLVADDDSSVRQVLRHILEAGNHEVAEHLSISQSFDTVIRDPIMRGVTGLQAAREILHVKPGQKIIFRKKAEELGIRCFLAKPFRGDEVVDVIVRALSGGDR